MKSTRSHRLLMLSAAGVVALSAAGMANASTSPPETTAPSETTAATETTAAVETTAAAEATTAGTDAPGTTAGGESTGDVDLSGVCPETVVIQTDWNPEAEHGWIYEMVGDDPTIDKDGVLVRGPLVASGAETGVEIEIRSGGPAIGYQTVTSQLYTDEDILLGYVYTDEGIQNSVEFPTVAVMAGMEKNP